MRLPPIPLAPVARRLLPFVLGSALALGCGSAGHLPVQGPGAETGAGSIAQALLARDPAGGGLLRLRFVGWAAPRPRGLPASAERSLAETPAPGPARRAAAAARAEAPQAARLSRWDELFARHARRIGWDWRLLASQAFHESSFDPEARSHAGATGLLQLMPRTAAQFGVRELTDPEQNVSAAVRYLAWLEAYWEDEIEDPEERLRFVLASYNVGQGHMRDAQRLAAKHGDDPARWHDVSRWLIRKSQKQHYSDPVVFYGYCRGREPVQYVARVLARFERYRSFAPLPAEPRRLRRRSDQSPTTTLATSAKPKSAADANTTTASAG